MWWVSEVRRWCTMPCEATARVERKARTRARADFIVGWMDSDGEVAAVSGLPFLDRSPPPLYTCREWDISYHDARLPGHHFLSCTTVATAKLICQGPRAQAQRRDYRLLR